MDFLSELFGGFVAWWEEVSKKDKAGKEEKDKEQGLDDAEGEDNG